MSSGATHNYKHKQLRQKCVLILACVVRDILNYEKGRGKDRSMTGTTPNLKSSLLMATVSRHTLNNFNVH